MFADDDKSQREVLMSTAAHQKELTAQTLEEERRSIAQEGLPIAAAHAKQTCNKETRERVCQVKKSIFEVATANMKLTLCCFLK